MACSVGTRPLAPPIPSGVQSLRQALLTGDACQQLGCLLRSHRHQWPGRLGRRPTYCQSPCARPTASRTIPGTKLTLSRTRTGRSTPSLGSNPPTAHEATGANSPAHSRQISSFRCGESFRFGGIRTTMNRCDGGGPEGTADAPRGLSAGLDPPAGVEAAAARARSIFCRPAAVSTTALSRTCQSTTVTRCVRRSSRNRVREMPRRSAHCDSQYKSVPGNSEREGFMRRNE